MTSSTIQKSKNQIRDIVHNISFNLKKRTEIFLSLPVEIRPLVLLHLRKSVLCDLISQLPNKELINALEKLDPDKATDIIQVFPQKQQKKIIEQLTEELKNQVRFLSKFDPLTAAGLMSLNYIQIEEDDSIEDLIKRIKIHEKRTARFPTILVVREGRLIGYIPGHKIGFALPEEPIKKYIAHIPVIKHDANYKEVIKLFKEHPHSKVAVLDDSNNILGVIYADDILRVLEEQESALLYNFAGLSKEESITDRARTKVKFRYKWLIINLATALLAAFTVKLFDQTISKYVLLAVYMPVVAGMGGNAATQTLAVMVRGLTLRKINTKTLWYVLKNELGAGFINGLINAVIIALIVVALNHNYAIAFILGLALVINLLVAGFFGTLIPVTMRILGKDPASSATIFITTATDVLGFLVFLGLATLILS